MQKEEEKQGGEAEQVRERLRVEEDTQKEERKQGGERREREQGRKKHSRSWSDRV